MWKGITCFNSAVYVLTVRVCDQFYLDLSCFEYSPKDNNFLLLLQKTQRFIVHKKTVGKRPGKEITYLGLKTLLDHHSGVFFPFFIAQIDDKCYLFCLENFEWFIKYSFQVPKIDSQTTYISHTEDFSIIDGPTLVWINKDTVYIYKAEYSHLKSIDCLFHLSVEKLPDVHLSGKVLWWNSAQNFSDCSEQGMVVFGKGKSDINGYLINLVNRSASIQLITAIIPAVYLLIMTCSCLLSWWSNPCNVFICTSQRQLLEFCEGQYIRHINIPLSHCENIHPFECYSGDLILVCSQQSDICFVNWNTRQIIRSWSSYCNFLIDDFIGNGTEQILLFSDNGEKLEDIFNTFILSDMINDDIFSNTENHGNLFLNEAVGQSSMNGVLNALEQKVKVAEASVTESRTAKFEKMSFVKKHCDVLQDIVMAKQAVYSSQSSSTSLASLLVGSPIFSDKLDRNAKSSMLVVLSKWQDIYDSKWIVELEIENVGESTVCDISLCLIGPISSYSKVYTTSASNLIPQLNNKACLLPGQKVLVTCVTPVPHYNNENCFTAGLMLSWKEACCHYVQCCGNIFLTLEDMLKGMHTEIDKARICSPFVVTLIETKVALSNTNCQNKFCFDPLKSKMSVCDCCRGWVRSPSDTRYRLQTSGLDSVHIGLANTPDGMVIKIFTRDYSQLYYTLWTIKRLLPDDVRWTTADNQKLVGHMINYINKELISSIEKLGVLLRAKPVTAEEVTVISEKSEEIVEKRRRLSELNDNASGSKKDIECCDCIAIFSDICHCVSATEQIFTLLFSISKTSYCQKRLTFLQ